MTLDLRSIPAAVINLATDMHRRAYMEEQFTSLGIEAQFIPGVTKFGKKKSVASAYSNAFDAMGKAPFVIFEDDQELLWDDCILPDIPPEADIIYLANSQNGCLPDTPENKKKYALRAFNGLALAEAYDENYLRLFSMISAMAVYVVSERGRERYRAELTKAYKRSTAIDIRFAFAMPALNVFGLRRPMFAEKPSLQIASKKSASRFAETHDPLRVASEGEIRSAKHRIWNLKVQAERDPATKALYWHVLEADQTNTRNQTSKPALPLPGYNQDILKDRYEIIENAKVFPPDSKTRSCGVTDTDGNFVRFSHEFRAPKKPHSAPEERRVNQNLPVLQGTYVYGGWLHPHFGHFLLESTSRLWAVDEYSGQIDGVLFVPFGPNSIWRTRKAYGNIIRLLTGGLDIVPETHPRTVERLIVAEPGFGHQERMKATDKYISLTRRNVANAVAAKGTERLYISRSGLNDKRGGVFGEKLIEACMVANGYEIFHPQQHSATEQLAKYRAARYLVSLDGSALHFAAYALEPGAKVAIIARRTASVLGEMEQQLRRFAGAEVDLINVVAQMWVNKGSTQVSHRSFGELDLVQLSKRLIEKGYISDPSFLRQITKAEISDYLKGRQDDLPPLVPYRRN